MTSPPLDGGSPRRTKMCIHCGREYGPDPRWPKNFKTSKVCGSDCAHARKRHTPEMARAKFWSRVDIGRANACWPFTGPKDKWGYGDLQWERKHVQAHRLAWKLLRGDPGELDCLHRCNNAACCNPEHMYLGTDLENARDRIAAGKYGKLSAAQVREIRALFPTWTFGMGKELARKYGVSEVVISKLKLGATYNFVT
jgi:hypothetical protein